MKTDLPEPAEYYRPARAQALREEADRLERWGVAAGRWALLVPLGPAALRFVLGLVYPDGMSLLVVSLQAVVTYLSILASGAVLGLPVWAPLWWLWRARLNRLRRESDALEAEHEARYGAPSAFSEGTSQTPKL